MQFSVEAIRDQLDSRPRDQSWEFAVGELGNIKQSVSGDGQPTPNDAMCIAISRHAYEDTYFQNIGVNFKLGDFGLSHYSSEMPHGLVGTELFLSPQAMNGLTYAKADEFALGATIYALLCEGYPIKNHLKEEVRNNDRVVKTTYKLIWKGGSLESALNQCNSHRVSSYGVSYALTPGALRVLRMLLGEEHAGTDVKKRRRSVSNVLQDPWFASYLELEALDRNTIDEPCSEEVETVHVQ